MGKIKIFLLSEVKDKVLVELRNHLQNLFNLEIEIISKKQDINFAYNEKRKQYSAEEILKNFEKNKDKNYEKWLFIVDADLYCSGLNFVFGVANPYSGVSIISLTRLKQQFYGKSENEVLYIERIKKEATHELGHLFYLNHCQNKKCVMRFSNSLYETDEKNSFFCDRCKKILIYNINQIRT
ncbi:MAG: archaemetzincin family Zn-dependent metalloprotease [Thermodesulfovibrio sp.]|nr:archaemetzincin family Zn-dependent metalloprotease [Thermodesulfovibrio sp.]